MLQDLCVLAQNLTLVARLTGELFDFPEFCQEVDPTTILIGTFRRHGFRSRRTRTQRPPVFLGAAFPEPCLAGTLNVRLFLAHPLMEAMSCRHFHAVVC